MNAKIDENENLAKIGDEQIVNETFPSACSLSEH